METILVFFALLGGGQSDQSIDPASMVMKHLVKGVYDETRVQEEKNAPHFIDKIRILE
jgi:hypothetical protein|tara:strand:+ start:333 stop:506 length:174 start_codon:yes stop_codon:yes gene_type:complete